MIPSARRGRCRAGPEPVDCRACGALVEAVVDLGSQPASGVFPWAADPIVERLPLRMGACRSCGLAQLADPSSVEEGVPDGPSPLTSATMAAHAGRFVDDLVARGLANPSSRVLSLASHGGHLAPALGERGIDARIGDERLSLPDEPAASFDLLIDNYLLAHLEHPRAALAKMAGVLAPGGTLVLEFDDLLATVEGGQWDAIGLGHPVYLSLRWLHQELGAIGLVIVDAIPQPVYGGALRIFARAGATSMPSVAARLALELSAGIGTPSGLGPLAIAVHRARRDVVPHLRAARAAGRRVAGYGAPGRAITFLNALDIGPDLLPFVADRSVGKQGRVVPGVRVPIVSPEALLSRPPDEVLILTWNLAAEIRQALAPLVAAGTRLLVAVPELADVTDGSPGPTGANGAASVR